MSLERFGRWRWLVGLLAGAMFFGLAYVLMLFVPTPGADFHAPDSPFIDYPPWITILVLPVRSLAIANALTLTALAFALWRSNAKPIHYLLAFTSMPLYANLWLGQYEFIPLLGLTLLPWGLPLAVTKPQVAFWGVAAWWLRQPNKWKIAIAVIGGVLLSFLVYGWWPARLQSPTTLNTFYNLSAWYWGGPLIGLIAVAATLAVMLKTRDVDQAMALGALATPYIQNHSYLLLLPAFARLSGWRLIGVWLMSWGGVVSIFLGDAARVLALLFPLAIWAALHWNSPHTPEEGA
jgi:hypothetical protein